MSIWGHKKLLEAGQPSPQFELSLAGGGAKSLKDILAAGPALLAFFKVDCPVCQFTFAFLERLHQGQPGGALRIYAVSQDDAADTRAFQKEYGITFPALLDGKGYPVSNAFGIAHVPTLFLIEPGGAIAWANDGFSRKGIEMLAQRAGVIPFQQDEYVPEWRAG